MHAVRILPFSGPFPGSGSLLYPGLACAWLLIILVAPSSSLPPGRYGGRCVLLLTICTPEPRPVLTDFQLS